MEQNCWNGRDRGVYQNKVVNDGLASQEQNPEVDVDTSRPDVDINEQIFALKLATNKLENAYNGHSVEWPHYEPSKLTYHLISKTDYWTIFSSCGPQISL